MYNHTHPPQKSEKKNHKTTFRNGFYRKLSLNKSLDFFSFQTYEHYALTVGSYTRSYIPTNHLP